MVDSPKLQERVAIIGTAGRFPGASDVDALWQLLCEGREAVVFLSDDECRAAGVDEAMLSNPHYIRACMPLADVEYFDADFFGMTSNQATSLDPQARIFLECCWHALENAGYDAEQYSGTIGVFAGSGENHYLLRNLQRLLKLNSYDMHQTLLDASSDFLTTRVSYKLGLSGPSISIKTACSTSLVAVHLGCMSLQNRESDIALCGGVSVKPPPYKGYLYQEGSFRSSDGHCRAYSAQGKGAIGGNGAGVVVLRRLSDAIADNDNIIAVICGTAVNNDGRLRVGFTAPGVDGQIELLRHALFVSGLGPHDISYIEGHGTGTVLGDAVELTALREVFDNAKCELGSLKTNIGHLDSAAGVAGLIKAALCLKHRSLVPSLNYANPNPVIASPECPLSVNTEFKPWSACGNSPLRAGVSSFGMGGTNAHAILEEYVCEPRNIGNDDLQIVPISAQSTTALASYMGGLGAAVSRSEQRYPLADVAYTMKVGRRSWQYRHFVVAATPTELIGKLTEPLPAQALAVCARSDRRVVFLCPGQGLPLLGVARSLYDTDAVFRECLDTCADLIRDLLSIDIRGCLCAGHSTNYPDSGMNDTRLTQPAVFALTYSVGKLLIRQGIVPHTVIGHSLGEYVAATLAGVMSADDALRLVCSRADLVAQLPPGAMLAIGQSADEVERLLPSGVSIAAINSDSQCVVAGLREGVSMVEAILAAQNIPCHRLPATHAFHSSMLLPAVDKLVTAAKTIEFATPNKVFVSCLTGEIIGQGHVLTAEHWGQHLVSPVQFSTALISVELEAAVVVDLGPGNSLLSSLRRQVKDSGRIAYFSSLSAAGDTDAREILNLVGRVWQAGAGVVWSQAHALMSVGRVPLPGYPFERKRFWIDAPSHLEQSKGVTTASVESTSPPSLQVPIVSVERLRTPARTELERNIAATWEEVLGIKTIGVDESFLDLGGDSLVALRVLARLDEMYGVTISPRTFLAEAPTVAALAVAVVSALVARSPADTVTQNV